MKEKQEYDLSSTNVGRFYYTSMEELWFAFMKTYQCLENMNHKEADNVSLPREHAEAYKAILSILDKMFRARRLLIDHLRVLRFYGRRGLAPRLAVQKEALAHTLWLEAFKILEPLMIEEGYLADELQLKWKSAERDFGVLFDRGEVRDSEHAPLACVVADHAPSGGYHLHKTDGLG